MVFRWNVPKVISKASSDVCIQYSVIHVMTQKSFQTQNIQYIFILGWCWHCRSHRLKQMMGIVGILPFTSSAFFSPLVPISTAALFIKYTLLLLFLLLQWIVFVVHSLCTNDYAMLPQLVWFLFLCIVYWPFKWKLAESGLISKRLKTIYRIFIASYHIIMIKFVFQNSWKTELRAAE